MKIKTQTDCCEIKALPPQKRYVVAASAFSFVAAFLAGIGCLGCIPLVGVALAATSLAGVLDEHLTMLQYALATVAAVFSFFYFRKNRIASKIKIATTLILYVALFWNIHFFQNQLFAIGTSVLLAIAHIFKLPVRPELKLLYFSGCPNYEALKGELHRRGLTAFREIDIDTLPKNDSLKNYSSPTLILGDEVLLGTSISDESTSCSFFSAEELKEAVEKAFKRRATKK